ncbi:alpha/beta fold hydrolase [Kribbella solani]|uniref:esterase/lipase family protein n=1 Tax=Kribbella solani TaxID=236067 RepID=UPI0029B117BC|nr:alpha/beta fold hydrolase [Kribbella solani]MDX2967555.1 alpha/beta fold hydrolase [Kribbella solani]MDX3002487.1 alpha/beta fold hydrolase [Kribbella solani]
MGSWQDDLRGALDGLAYGARSALTPSVIHGAAIELGWLTTHLAMYPLGVVNRAGSALPARLNLAGLGPAQRGLLVSNVRAAGTPILLAHGIIDNHTIFALLRRHLVRRGFGSIHTFSYSPLTLDVRSTAARMGREIEAICADSGSDQIHVIGHSLGGLIARYYVQRLGGDARVHTCLTLGTPHQGTVAAKLLPWPLVKQVRPDSDLMTELAEPAPGCRTRFISYYSDVDQLIVPQRRGRIRHPDLVASNARVHGVGHLSLPFHSDVVHGITDVLTEPDDQPKTA